MDLWHTHYKMKRLEVPPIMKDCLKFLTGVFFSYVFAVLFLVLIVVFGIVRLYNYTYKEWNIYLSILYLLQNVVILTVLAALSRLMFILGKSFII